MIVRHDIYFEIRTIKKEIDIDFGYMLMEDFHVKQSLSTTIKYIRR